ncbi:hypothetical protein NPIL_379981 [Nephila pilipes]|uniref:Uncharacterized protein n=1 Tax=Nephila pilipes TaxID=299642 RepID=A0A8X6MRF4_NEPPI|nr:hypothetical protein NPIL_379981 [Nephila pilipes]
MSHTILPHNFRKRKQFFNQHRKPCTKDWKRKSPLIPFYDPLLVQFDDQNPKSDITFSKYPTGHRLSSVANICREISFCSQSTVTNAQKYENDQRTFITESEVCYVNLPLSCCCSSRRIPC